MALIHAGTTLFGSNTHTDIMPVQYDTPLQIGQWAGLIGESHIMHQTKGRDLACIVDAYNYNTEPALENALTTIQALVNSPLHGTLRIIFPSRRYVDYSYCTFLGADKIDGGLKFEPVSNRWYSKLVFRWRQAQ